MKIQKLETSSYTSINIENQTYIPKTSHSYIHKRSLSLSRIFLLFFFLALLGSARAQDDDDDDDSAPVVNRTNTQGSQGAIEQANAQKAIKNLTQYYNETYGQGKVTLTMDSIDPEAGPTTGNTRVLVRGGSFNNLQLIYPHPKCRFGNYSYMVNATYVTCTPGPLHLGDPEPHLKDRNETCLQCDNSPNVGGPEIVPLTISLIGDFSDCINSIPFRYYWPTKVNYIYPFYGPTDGGTEIDVFGENFLNFDENSVCTFGTKATQAKFVNTTYVKCIAPYSDVVQKPIPFSISMNRQQGSRDIIDFWYFNLPQVAEVDPSEGPDSGGNNVTLRGSNFDPFIGEEVSTKNTTHCMFEGIGFVKAYVVSPTTLICEAPPYIVVDRASVFVEVSLNHQQYTDDNRTYTYYAPPQLFDVDPREGPTKGGTLLTIYGNKFQKGKNITCKFGDKFGTNATFIANDKITCVSPAYDHPGFVELTVSYAGERYSSEVVKYYYYDTPIVLNITPTCGPVTGYTQITVFGRNYVDRGFGKAKCIFNDTIFMNATIMSGDIIKCDSPPLPASMGFADQKAPFYLITITLNGQQTSETSVKFIYYIDPVIKSIWPNRGPLRGGTNSSLVGAMFNQEGVCNVTVRYGAIQQKIKNFTDTLINITSPNATIPDAVVVSVALNGQQFIHDKTLHFRDLENTFTYYQDIYISDYSPKAGPTSGKTEIRVQGLGFNQFKKNDGSGEADPLWVRFVDSTNHSIHIGEASQAYGQTDTEFYWRTPPADVDTKALMQVSFNKHDWQNVKLDNSTYSYHYYNAPRVISITPPYGPVKSQNDETIVISGQNFECPETDCKDLYVRFGDPVNGIVVKGNLTGTNEVTCSVPKYTKPDVLPVEVTFNGIDYTSDNQTYGFFDPYILDVKPRLISTKGTTLVRLYGFGFVNSTGTDLKAKFGSIQRGSLDCTGKNCVQMATYIDKTTIETPTFTQSSVFYKDNGDNIKYDGMAVEACVYGSTYTENNIEVYYYEEPFYSELSSSGSPSNQEKPIFTTTDFKWPLNDVDKFRKHNNYTCRFQSKDGKRVMYTKARMEIYPLGLQEPGAKPDHVRCQSPKWKTPEQVKMDLSVNGQDYSGDFVYTFYDPLDLYRIVPMSGPNEGNTKVKLYGTGFSSTMDPVFTKWGILQTEKQQKDQVTNYIYTENDFIQNAMVAGSEILQAYKKEAYNVDKQDYPIAENQTLKIYPIAHSPKLSNWNRTHGGPIYMSVGEHLVLNVTNYTYDETVQQQNITYYNKTVAQYSSSMVEYYYYQQPVIKKVHPKNGLTRGGTRIEISGAWFKYRPEYGIVPHCKIGDKVTRAQYFSTVRIVCVSPPNDDIYQTFPLYVSLNGVDFVDSGSLFNYYEQPTLYTMTPAFGPETGGTKIEITGSKFSNISDPQNFNCRFTDIERDVPPKYIPAFYKNQTAIICSSPGGWGRGDSVKVQVTINGEDYSDNDFIFGFYSIVKAFPRSGPSDGTGGPIMIYGSGFRNETKIQCMLDKAYYDPVFINATMIMCPMVRAPQGPDYFGNVDFSVYIDGNENKFIGGFQYYAQPILVDMTPHRGPSEGNGTLYFYGTGFRDDFALADIGCKIGDGVGKGVVVSPTMIRCTVEEMQLVDEGFNLPATVALNSYSWVPTNQTFIPYGLTGLYPNSGPITGNTDILVSGKGFTDDLQEKAKCRFGINSNFVIVDALIVDYDKLTCKSPADFILPAGADNTISIPFGISFGDEDMEPWTLTTHRFRFYPAPKLTRCDPDEIEVGKMGEVYVYADDDSEFFEPIPTGKGGQYGLTCKFGRFGTGLGTFVNKTTVRCDTPSVSEDPDDIWRETVKLTVALNGQDYDEEGSDLDFTFIGTGSTLVFWPYVVGTLLIGLLLVALIMFCSALLQKVNFDRIAMMPKQGLKLKQRPYVIRDPYDQFTSRTYSSGQVGRGSAGVEQ